MLVRYSNTLYTGICRTLIIVLSACFSMGLQKASAQLYPIGTIYFQNQYLANPALAGTDAGLNINGGYRTQWNNISGAPTVQALTADYAITGKAGVGINFYNDKAGLFKRTRAVATYAYHLPLNAEGNKLHFGISLGFMNERISNDDIDADADDVMFRSFNERETFVDGDFGMAYTGKKLSFQAAVPNLKNILRRDNDDNSVDKNTFFSAVSYKMTLSEGTNGFGLEPKVVFRGIKGFDNIFDAGANVSYAENKVNLFAMYHSSESASFGLGFNYLNMSVNGIYTTPTTALRRYSTGDFAINLGLRLLKKR